MTPTRRGFLSLFAAAAIDPERLLWVPGKKLISIPAPRLRYVSMDLGHSQSSAVFWVAKDGIYQIVGSRAVSSDGQDRTMRIMVNSKPMDGPIIRPGDRLSFTFTGASQ